MKKKGATGGTEKSTENLERIGWQDKLRRKIWFRRGQSKANDGNAKTRIPLRGGVL